VGRVVGVIPAAGHATRLQPLVGSKEAYPIAGRPALDYLVERMRAVEGAELRLVTRPDKADVIEAARTRGIDVIEAAPPSLGASIRAGLREVGNDDVVLLGFPDSLWNPVEGYVRLIERLDDAPVVLGLFDSPDPERSDVVDAKADRVERVHVKPAQPPSSLIWGCGVARAGELELLER
jgi:glucose-1-phosphate thymidylyltransferase